MLTKDDIEGIKELISLRGIEGILCETALELYAENEELRAELESSESIRKAEH